MALSIVPKSGSELVSVGIHILSCVTEMGEATDGEVLAEDLLNIMYQGWKAL